ncbi:MAG: pyrroline-5-carboxylate reductase [Vampirovibrio sp.]
MNKDAEHKRLQTLNIGVIGLGRMSGAILQGVLRAGVSPSQCWAAGSSGERAMALTERYGIVCVGPAGYGKRLAETDVLILGVKPHVMSGVLDTLQDVIHKFGLKPNALIISIAAGVTLASMERVLETAAVLRAMPNTPALIGEGLTALSANTHVTPAQKTIAESIFASVGQSVWVPEAQLNAFTGLFGSGPAYVMLMMEALAEAGLAQGLTHEVVWQGVPQLFKGSALLLQERGLHPAVLKNEVITPQGTTIAGLQALEAHGVRHALAEAVKAATRRAETLS